MLPPCDDAAGQASQSRCGQDLTGDIGTARSRTRAPRRHRGRGEPDSQGDDGHVDPEDDSPPDERDEAAPGDRVQVHYVGVAHSTGEQFDASYDRGQPLEFPLGAGRVIAGWDAGVVGMKVGGRRQLVIPPHLAYGDRGAGGVIKPGETLIFVVDLVDVA